MNSFINYIEFNNCGVVHNLLYPNRILKGEYIESNTTCVWYKDSLVVNTRLLDYNKIFQNHIFDVVSNKISQTYLFKESGIKSRNIISSYKNNELKKVQESNYSFDNDIDAFYKGLEDCRLVVWDGKLYAYGTRWDKISDKGCICIYELNEQRRPINEIVVPPLNSNCEKNWGAVSDRPFTFVYTNNPLVLIKVNMDGTHEFIKEAAKNENINDLIKGSTQVVRYDENTYVSLVHTNKCYTENDVYHTDYLTAFVFYDNDLNIIKMSDWFVFNSPMCEFSCGLAVEGNDVYITYSQLDCTSHLIVTNKQCIEKFIEYNKEDHNNLKEYYEYYVLANRYERMRKYGTSSVLYNYCGVLMTRNGIINEQTLECVIKTFSNIINYADKLLVKKLYDNLIGTMLKQLEYYPNNCELNCLLASLYKIKNDKENYNKYKNLFETQKVNVHNYFFKYFNPNYL